MAAVPGTCWASAPWKSHVLLSMSPPNQVVCCRPGTSAAATSHASAFSEETVTSGSESVNRRLLLVGVGALTSTIIPSGFSYAEVVQSTASKEVPGMFRAFVDRIDGYSYYYPADWRDFDFIGHDSAFKDRNLALQHVRVNFIPTNNTDIRDLGPMEEVIPNLVKNVYAAPIQMPTIFDMQERSVDGKNYWTFEYVLTSPNFARTAFATIAIGNGRYYTLVVGANQRRWKRVRDKLKVVAESFKILDI